MLSNNKNIIKHLLVLLSCTLLFFLINSCKKELFQGITEPDDIHTSSLYLDSNPKSLRIYLDDKYLGAVSPDTVRWLPSGKHKITLKHELYPDTSFFIDLINDQVTSVYVNGFANPNFYGKLYLESTPTKAAITLNDSIFGLKTPYYWSRLLPGIYKIKLEYEKHRPDSVLVKIKGGEYKLVNILLEDTTKYITYKVNNSGIMSNNITQVAVDKNNLKWIGSIDEGITTFDGKNWNKIEQNEIFKSTSIVKLKFDKDDRLWVINGDGLLMYDRFSWFNFSSQIGTDLVNDVNFDNYGNVYVSTSQGLYFTRGNDWINYNITNSCIGSNTIYTSCVTRNGDLWVGTKNNDAVMFISSDTCHFIRSSTFEDFDPSIAPNIKIFVEDYEGKIWQYHRHEEKSIYRDAITVFNNPNMEELILSNVNPNLLNDIYVGDNDNVWFCTDRGAVMLKANGQVVNVNKTTSGKPINNCQSIMKDLSGDYWIASMGGGMIRVKKGTIN